MPINIQIKSSVHLFTRNFIPLQEASFLRQSPSSWPWKEAAHFAAATGGQGHVEYVLRGGRLPQQNPASHRRSPTWIWGGGWGWGWGWGVSPILTTVILSQFVQDGPDFKSKSSMSWELPQSP